MLVETAASKYTTLLFQSRTPALVFEHVNNTDFKVRTSLLLYSIKLCCVRLWKPPFLAYSLSSRTRVCMWWRNMKVQCYVFSARKSIVFWFYPQSLAHSHRSMWVMCDCSMNACCLLTARYYHRKPNDFVLVSSNCTRPWQTMTSGTTCTRSSRWVLHGSASAQLVIYDLQLWWSIKSLKVLVFLWQGFFVHTWLLIQYQASVYVINIVCVLSCRQHILVICCCFFGMTGKRG